MSISTVTRKGRVTIPADVRKALGIEPGDDLLFDVAPDQTVSLRVIKRQRLADLYGALRATRPFAGKEAIREQVGLKRGRS
jgi:AbrB family looped-hinge helix DNA binding protein